MTDEEALDEVTKLLDPILDCFGGADGGVSFVKLRALLVQFQKSASDGYPNSQEIMLAVKRFSKLVKVAGEK